MAGGAENSIIAAPPAIAPGGSHLAAWAMGRADRWQAGAELMQAASPRGIARARHGLAAGQR